MKATPEFERMRLQHEAIEGMSADDQQQYYLAQQRKALNPDPIRLAIEFQVAHQIERRKLWVRAYLTPNVLRPSSTGTGDWNGTTYSTCQIPMTREVFADTALRAFDKKFPVIHAQ